MAGDKFAATWVSHSSIGDFKKCPRAYFLKNIYKDPKTGHKIQIATPPLSLGQAVHEVLESLSVLPTQQRLKDSLIDKYEVVWKKFSGKKGGFLSEESEKIYKNRGSEMLKRVYNNPGPIARLAVKLKDDLPAYWLSEDENIMLCGKIDWLEYFAEDNSVHIIDFKTGKYEEDTASLQLPIYHLLVHNCQKRKALKASYWYLATDDHLTTQELPDISQAHEKVLAIARQIKAARKLEKLNCQNLNGCSSCTSYEKIVKGEGEFVGINDYNQDVYILKDNEEVEEDSYIL